MLIQSRIDTFLVEAHFGANELGKYAAALRLTELLDTIGIVLSLVLIPAFARLSGQTLEREIEKAYLCGTLLYLLALPILGFVQSFFGNIYGDRYADAAELIPLLAFRPFFYMLAVIRIAALIARNQVRWIPIYPALACGLIWFLFDPFTATHDLKGAAIAGTLGIGGAGILGDFLVNRSNLIRLIRCPLAMIDLWSSLTGSFRRLSR
jgi:O-antigen/teichoic acid export membrane protein